MPLNPPGQNTTIRLSVTAPDNATTITYTLTVARPKCSNARNLEGVTIRVDGVEQPLRRGDQATTGDVFYYSPTVAHRRRRYSYVPPTLETEAEFEPLTHP